MTYVHVARTFVTVQAIYRALDKIHQIEKIDKIHPSRILLLSKIVYHLKLLTIFAKKKKCILDVLLSFEFTCANRTQREKVRVRSFSSFYFPTFGLNTERYRVYLRIQSECGKIQTRKTPNTDPLHAAVCSIKNILRNFCHITLL